MQLHNNKEWLRQKYVDEKLSTYKIAKLCNIGDECIRLRLHKFNIPIRSRSEAEHLASGNHCNLSQEAIEWINGELLGDGGLYSRCPYSAFITYSSKYLEYIEYVRDTLKSFGIEQSGGTHKEYCKNTNTYVYHYNSRVYKELLAIREQWYPEGKKIVPRDIKLTPLVLRQMFIGDGSLIHGRERSPHIMICTDSFPISCVNWFINKLFDLGFKATRQSSNRIHVSSCSTKSFLEYIGKCPVNCYQYKFEY